MSHIPEYCKKLDSLFRFYGSQITAHSNYLVGWSFAFAIFFYRVIDRIEKNVVVWYDILLIIIFIIFGIWLRGRLLYYSELSETVQDCMGITQQGKTHSEKYVDLVKEQEKKRGLANVITAILLSRIRYRLLKQVDEGFGDIVDIKPITKLRACSITFSNFLLQGYKNTLKEIIN